ncbi:hypothetical protein HA466_0012980 [Hirschfeldia incana]|nr:hypothetical protein HA466_0012980 [Hirschfeldia incana]
MLSLLYVVFIFLVLVVIPWRLFIFSPLRSPLRSRFCSSNFVSFLYDDKKNDAEKSVKRGKATTKKRDFRDSSDDLVTGLRRELTPRHDRVKLNQNRRWAEIETRIANQMTSGQS